MLLRRSTSFRAPEGTSDRLPPAQESSPLRHCHHITAAACIFLQMSTMATQSSSRAHTPIDGNTAFWFFLLQKHLRLIMPKLSTCCREPPPPPSSFMPCLLLTFPESGVERTEWRSRRAREREGEITKSDPKRREREGERGERGAHKGLNAEWGKLPSRSSFKGFYGIKERVKSVWPSRAWASVD